jgi:teichuronic acid biosynthesis glycosyltransferase TuaC
MVITNPKAPLKSRSVIASSKSDEDSEHVPLTGATSRAPYQPLRVLTVTTLFPNQSLPTHGIFVENRLRRVLATGAVKLHVIAPVPWFPFRAKVFGRYAAWARVPRLEERHGIPVAHPRYLVLPKIGMWLQPLCLYLAMLSASRSLRRQGSDWDLVDAHYYYPDGVAAALLARHLGKPLTVTARGTDLNLVPRFWLPRAMIRWAAKRANASIAVCEALKEVLVRLGIAAPRVHVLRNGVDLNLFRPMERAQLRSELKLDGPVLLSVGHLIERKGHHLVLEALTQLPGVTLLVVGDGPERRRLMSMAEQLGIKDRVRFLGAVPHERLPALYNAGDILVLASSREGWANVLLEAMACGTAVAATKIWGTPEVVTEEAAGILLEERSAAAIVKGVRKLLSSPPERSDTRAFAERFSWDATTQGQIHLFRDIVAAAVKTPSKDLA